MTQYPIGVFSRMTRLPVSTLRYYHEIGLLTPDYVDPTSKYRFYSETSIARARAIVALRDIGLSLPDIGETLESYGDEADLREILSAQRARVEAQTRKLKDQAARLDALLAHIDGAKGTATALDVEVTDVEDVLFGGRFHEGPWSDFGQVVGGVARRAGRHIGGPAVSLCHDEAYLETARYEAGFVLKRSVRGLDCRVLEGGPAVRAVHVGPYATLEFTYERMMRLVFEREFQIVRPTREIYLKGPGLIFTGRPEKYQTEIIIRVEPASSADVSPVA